MSFWDSLSRAATQVATTASNAARVAADTASVVGKKVSETAAAATTVVYDTASSVGKKVSETTSAATTAVSSFMQSSYAGVCNFSTMKIKGMLRGIDLQSSIDALNKHQKEKGTDVSALVNFLQRLKDFSEDGK